MTRPDFDRHGFPRDAAHADPTESSKLHQRMVRETKLSMLAARPKSISADALAENTLRELAKRGWVLIRAEDL